MRDSEEITAEIIKCEKARIAAWQKQKLYEARLKELNAELEQRMTGVDPDTGEYLED